MQKAHKIKLNPTDAQEAQFMRAAGIARFAYNWALAEYQAQKEAGQTVDWNALKKQFRVAIDSQFPFVREVTKCAFEEAIHDCRRAINTYYKAKPKNKLLRFPKFRSRRKRIGGFGIANDKFTLDDHAIRLPKIGSVNMTEALRFEGRVLSGRVREDRGHWHLTVVVECEGQPCAPGAVYVGIDFGLKAFATLSTGEVAETQGHYRKAEAKLKRLQRALSRKQKGSANQEKARAKVAKSHARVRCQRQDFIHKFTSSTCQRFGVVSVEDLNLKGLCRTRLAKGFHDAGIGEAIRQLEYKQSWRGGTLNRVNRFFPSSKRCHCCGWVNQSLTLSDRQWTCEGCGAKQDRDRNAAINIDLEGRGLPVDCGYVHVKPVELSVSTTLASAALQTVAVKQAA